MSDGHRHLSQFTIDAVALDQLDGALRSTADEHLAGCAACRGRLESTRTDDSAVAAGVASAPAWLASASGGAKHVARRRLRRGALVTGLAAAAAVAIVAGRAGDPTAGSSGGSSGGRVTRPKGPTLSVLAHVERAATGVVLELEEGIAVEPGDRVQLSYTAPEPGYLAVTGRDAVARVTVYHPARPAPAGTDVPLPFSIELDGAPGDEIVQVTWCPDPAPLASLMAGGPLPASCAAAEVRLTRKAP